MPSPLILHNHHQQTQLLSRYLHEVAYPQWFDAQAPVLSSGQLALALCHEFYTFLGPRSVHDWLADFMQALTALLARTGESAYCVRLTLRETAVTNRLHATL